MPRKKSTISADESPANPPGFKERLERHWLTAAIGIAIAAGALTYTVAAFFSDKTIELERLHVEQIERDRVFEGSQHAVAVAQNEKEHAFRISVLENQLSSVNRSLAGGTTLNVAKLLSDPGEARIPGRTAKYFSEDSFFADEPDSWHHKIMAISEVNKLAFDVASVPNPFSAPELLHAWLRGEPVSLESNCPIKRIGPAIFVQRIPVEQFSEILAVPDFQLSAPIDKIATEVGRATAKTIEGGMVFRDDLLGAFLSAQLGEAFRLRFLDRTQVSLVNVQKLENVVYSQIRITLEKPKVAEKQLPFYYVNIEAISIATKDSVYLVTTINPSEEPVPRGTVAAEITGWLSDFVIVRK